MKTHKIALIPGDGIGRDVTDAAWSVLQTVAAQSGCALSGTESPGPAPSTKKPADDAGRRDRNATQLRRHSSRRGRVAGGGAGCRFATRTAAAHPQGLRAICQYPTAPVAAGVQGPLKAEGFDILCIRENTEGEYSGAGGASIRGSTMKSPWKPRSSPARASNASSALASNRHARGAASLLRSPNPMRRNIPWCSGTRSPRTLAAEYPDVEVTSYHVDALAARMVMAPESLDVIVASNLFGDILTDLGAAIQGGLGFAASANINPDRSAPSMFEPVHGSAPDIAGKGIANPMATIWSGAMMLDHLGEKDAAARVMAALSAVTAKGIGTVAGKDSTDTITAAVIAALTSE